MTRIKLLLIEREASLSYGVKHSLELSGNYEVQTASNGEEGWAMYLSFRPDVIVVDIEEPVFKDGKKIIEKIRDEDKSVPIILVCEHTTNDIRNFYMHYADNLIKNLHIPKELDPHIQSILRRTKNPKIIDEKKGIVAIGEYYFDRDRQILQYKDSKDKIIKLSNMENIILGKLYEHRGEVILRDNLLTNLWGNSNYYTSRSLDVFICKLRKYLSHDPNIKIETIRRKGLLLSVSHDEHEV
ncbi:MAG: response regulator transcription factor [Dysgonamonadaceae bacterium]|jgi:DNA-binding response OmpR family regulator|nr:response regulator transcription factor [Dysgonamonadaceae bacterium]